MRDRMRERRSPIRKQLALSILYMQCSSWTHEVQGTHGPRLAPELTPKRCRLWPVGALVLVQVPPFKHGEDTHAVTVDTDLGLVLGNDVQEQADTRRGEK